ncbi:DUF6879 family protein [Actinomadura harenae]|uniref:DUF6879 family protein n=1 Tax=Actinomadura harenae TaxID=2483351 RepID=UPI0018F46F52|nr:DUF6879 family protein [Actinomadura harenae]
MSTCRNDPAYLAWQKGDREETFRLYSPWTDTAREAVSRGVDMRRVRIVSEPVSDYIRFEHAVTGRVNIAGGERIRWVPRTNTWDLLVPGCDGWLLDDEVALFYFFSGDGQSAGSAVSRAPATVAACASAFAAVWERGVDHAEYRV